MNAHVTPADDSSPTDTVIAVYADHHAAEAAVKRLAAFGLELNSLSIVGKGYHTEEKVVGFYNVGDRVKIWGSRGAFWGSLWGLFFGGVILTTPVVGPVVALGYLTASVLSALEGAVVVGGLSALAAALSGIGVPRDSVVNYEVAIAADSFLVMAHGTADLAVRAKAVLDSTGATSVSIHQVGETGGQPVRVAAVA